MRRQSLETRHMMNTVLVLTLFLNEFIFDNLWALHLLLLANMCEPVPP